MRPLAMGTRARYNAESIIRAVERTRAEFGGNICIYHTAGHLDTIATTIVLYRLHTHGAATRKIPHSKHVWYEQKRPFIFRSRAHACKCCASTSGVGL